MLCRSITSLTSHRVYREILGLVLLTLKLLPHTALAIMGIARLSHGVHG